jgi:hypothetical protein
MVCWVEVIVYPCVDTDKGRFVHESESNKVQYCPATSGFFFFCRIRDFIDCLCGLVVRVSWLQNGDVLCFL